jgi:hypothetical protein
VLLVARFVSCPSCGRTLFDLQEVTAQISERTGHLPGVAIAIMGCIVNGPGEMADADFGYVGGAPGKVDLYVGKEVRGATATPNLNPLTGRRVRSRRQGRARARARSCLPRRSSPPLSFLPPSSLLPPLTFLASRRDSASVRARAVFGRWCGAPSRTRRRATR